MPSTAFAYRPVSLSYPNDRPRYLLRRPLGLCLLPGSKEGAAKPVLKGSTISAFETCHPIDTAPPVGEKMLLPHD